MALSWNEQTYVITGSSGAGKSEVCKKLAQLGALVIDADNLARTALEPGSAELLKVRELFGDKVFSGERLNRKALGEFIFKNQELKLQLEAIIHPKVAKLAQESFSHLSQKNLQPIIYDCPLYFETELRKKKFKKIILVTAAEELKIARLVARDGISREAIKERLGNQLSDAKRVPLADFVIENDGDLKKLELKVEELFTKLK